MEPIFDHKYHRFGANSPLRWMGSAGCLILSATFLSITAPCLGQTRTKSVPGGEVLSWRVLPPVSIRSASSSSTIRLPNGTLRTYCSGIVTSTSIDGVTWSSPTAIKLTPSSPGGSLRSPAVLQLTGLEYLMVYEKTSVEQAVQISRLFGATSSDGVTFKGMDGPHSGALLPASAGSGRSSPDLIQIGPNWLRMYYVSESGQIESATSDDFGKSWKPEGRVALTGLRAGQRVADPDIIKTSDGHYVLFFVTAVRKDRRIRSAFSADGRSFTLHPGDQMGDSGAHAASPDVVNLAPGKHLMLFTEPGGLEGKSNVRSALAKK